MNIDLTEGKSVLNRDINVSESILSVYPELAPLLRNKDIEETFAQVDQIARWRKRVFTLLGTVSLILVCAVLIFLSWRLALEANSVNVSAKFEEIIAAAGLLAVGIQLYLFLSGLHRKWIYARFMAERIRLWKYQILLDGEFVSAGVHAPVNQFRHALKERWIVFYETLKHGVGGMNVFIDSLPRELVTNPTPYLDGQLMLRVRDAYLLLRLDVESSHFEDKNALLEPLDSITDSWAKALLGLSGLTAIAEVCLLAAPSVGLLVVPTTSFKVIAAILAGLALSFAIISSGIRVYRSASMLVEERERYHAKQTHLKRIREKIAGERDPNKLLSLMEEAETVCTEELQEFLATLRRANYFF
jgi:hypothetical protein